MFCRLCMIDDIADFRNLYNADGQQNEVYQTAALYFEKELHDAGMAAAANDLKCSRVICASCWRHISDFNDFRDMVLLAQKQYERLFQFEELGSEVKVEAMVDVPTVFGEIYRDHFAHDDADHKDDAGPDPVEVKEQKDVLQQLNELAAADFSSDDDKPLLKRLQKRTKKKKIAETTKQRKKREKRSMVNTGTGSKTIKIECSEPRVGRQALKTQEYDEFIAEHWKRDLNCGLCDQVCGNFSAVLQHFRSVHNTARAYVVCCNHKYHHRFHLVEHLNVHLNPELFKCPQCGKCSANRRNLQSHIKTVHPAKKLERIHECEICHKRFAKVSVLRTHLDTHVEGSKDHVCPTCNKGFVLESRLKIHMRTVHCPSMCELCGKSYRSPYVLKAHLLEEHQGVEKRKWPCDQCDAKLHSKHSLGRHKRVAHNDHNTAFVCSECGKVALTEDALRSHKKYVHTKERKYKCNICGKAFKVALVLKEHMTIHTGQDLYQCPHCPKTFRVSANMHHHRKRVHPKEWAEKRQHRVFATQKDLSTIANEVVI